MEMPNRMGLGILFFSIIVFLLFAMYNGVSFIWRMVDNHIEKYFYSFLVIIMLSFFIYSIIFNWKSSLSDSKVFFKNYKSEALIVKIITQRLSTSGNIISFDLMLEIKREDGDSYKTKTFFHTPIRNMEYFQIGKTIVVDVSAANPDKVRPSPDVYK